MKVELTEREISLISEALNGYADGIREEGFQAISMNTLREWRGALDEVRALRTKLDNARAPMAGLGKDR